MYEIRFHDERPIGAAAVVALNLAVGWWPERSDDRVAASLTPLAVGAWAGDQLVGFARAVSDGFFRAYVEDVMVHPDHRRRGVAAAMLERLLERLADIDVVSLFCADELTSVYARSGFKATRQIVLHRSSM